MEGDYEVDDDDSTVEMKTSPVLRLTKSLGKYNLPFLFSDYNHSVVNNEIYKSENCEACFKVPYFQFYPIANFDNFL